MTKRDYNEISSALDRILFSVPDKKFLTDDEKTAVAGTLMGFKMWFDEYAKENIE